MKKYFLFLIFSSLMIVPAFSQEADEIFVIVEEMPQFNGGETEMYKFLSTNIKYPEQARKDSIAGVVYVSFVVGTDGAVKDAKVIRGVHPVLDGEAIRVVNMMPAWKPGYQKGKPVNVQYNLPIRFKL